ncbi:predicted protein [Sparassis crispa]|uniref:Uncharacterized protein n=1 Tax=Sparassis crispa TaxID=139825 RepID=A0A401GIS7_9APHY|nr:predicted protein [Sparassis crispa]GBE82086.1 predicted protein [Sparassis crispa]
MSLRIRISKPGHSTAQVRAATVSSHSRQTHLQAAAEPSRHHKHAKRRIDSDEDVEGPERVPSEEPEAKKPRLNRAKTAESQPSADEGESEVDIEGTPDDADADVDVDVESQIKDARLLPRPSPLPVRGSSTKRGASSKSRAKGEKPAHRRSKRVPVWSDDEDEDEEYAELPQAVDDVDDDFAPEPVHRTSKRGAVTGKSREGKAGAGLKGGRGRSKKSKEGKGVVIMKDERKLPPTASSGTPGAGASTKRALIKDNEAQSLVLGAVDAQVDEHLKVKEPTPPPPKKRKLPTIKKNKPATGTTPSTPATTKPPAPLPAPSPAADPTGGQATDNNLNVGVGAGGRRPPMINTADVDLRDSSVYAQLFAKTGGSTPNSGLNRKEKEEERRKELNRMRDAARAKRAEEAKHCFDLQAAHEKIQRFEEKLRARRSTAVFPNILGAAFMTPQERARKGTNEERKER